MTAPRERDERPVYSISVAAAILEVHPQTLRIYERIGLLEPARSKGRIRLYSANDIERAHQIRLLTRERGINLAGVEVVFELLQEMEAMRQRMEAEIERMQRMLDERGGGRPAARRPAARRASDV